MTDSPGRPVGALPLVPAAAFVLVWSSGYISGPYGVQHVAPFTLLALRFGVAAVLALLPARILRGPLRIDRGTAGRIALTGIVMNAVQFGAMYLAFDAGLGATPASLLHALTPVLTAVLAALFLRESLSRRQVVGLVIGVTGVLIVLGPDVRAAGGPVAIGLAVFSAITLSLGTLGQRWIGHAPDPIWSAAIQFSVSAPPLAVLALVLEGTHAVTDPLRGGIAVAFPAIINSIVGLLLLGALVRRGEPAQGRACSSSRRR
ncbi:DMT family transporter [Nocardioides sp. B-3]|uniref:DMT family transporter n=1 Tax=Nocardioides sp. B-3 TaxID=2895565 RepID=UPI00215320E5|nr:DMT family transporter [Nocardioides sp. B-3]UUZ60190.1 DMT family transporter [Nocardioides sp. B-3]